MKRLFVTVVGIVLCVAAAPALAATTMYVNDFSGWSAAAGAHSTIDFETLPDGAPSVAGTPITASFNYTAQGATFSSNADLGIFGNAVTGFNLRAGTVDIVGDVYIDGVLVAAASAVGVFFPGGNSSISVFDADGNLLGSAEFSSSGSGFFLGAVSDTPIARIRQTRNAEVENMEAFVFVTAPTPPLSVAIDVKPGSDDNVINPRSSGVVQVAILSTPTFDATTVDIASASFGPGGAHAVQGRGHVEDVNGDGLADLVLRFRIPDSEIACGDTSVELRATTATGEEIAASDSITTRGCN